MTYDRRYDDIPVTIGIPAFNDVDYTRTLLGTIKWYTTHRNYRIVVIDDGSTVPECRQQLESICKNHEVEFLAHTENKGVSASWNMLCMSGACHGSDIVVLLNNDILVTPMWLEAAVYALKANEATGKVGSVFWEPINVPPEDVKQQMQIMAKNLWHTAYPFVSMRLPRPNGTYPPDKYPNEYWRSQIWGCGRVLAPNGCGFAFTLETYRKVGPFDENMKSFHEESDFGVRCAQQGMLSFGVPFPRIYHGSSRTMIEQRDVVKPHDRYAQSREVFLAKWDIPANRREGHDPFTYVNEKFMSAIDKVPVKVLYPVEPIQLAEVRGPVSQNKHHVLDVFEKEVEL